VTDLGILALVLAATAVHLAIFMGLYAVLGLRSFPSPWTAMANGLASANAGAAMRREAMEETDLNRHAGKYYGKYAGFVAKDSVPDAKGRIKVVDGLEFEGPSTQEAASVLESLEADGLILLILAQPDVVVEKSFRNLRQVRVAYSGNLGTHEVLYADWVLFTRDALEAVTS
jgi:large subunit ribosomal protein L4